MNGDNSSQHPLLCTSNDVVIPSQIQTLLVFHQFSPRPRSNCTGTAQVHDAPSELALLEVLADSELMVPKRIGSAKHTSCVNQGWGEAMMPECERTALCMNQNTVHCYASVRVCTNITSSTVTWSRGHLHLPLCNRRALQPQNTMHKCNYHVLQYAVDFPSLHRL